MSRIQIIIDSIAGAVGAVLGFMYGEVTGLFWALIAFMATDYITGVCVAWTHSGYVCFRRYTCGYVGGYAFLHSQRGTVNYRKCGQSRTARAEEAERYNGSAEEGKRGRIIC